MSSRKQFEVQQVNGNRLQITIDRMPDLCPYCHLKVDPKNVYGFISDILQVVFVCPNENCRRIFVGYYKPNPDKVYTLFSTSKGYVEKVEINQVIQDISPAFVKIFQEAYAAENQNLLEICGVGYRKALEFLVKDYIIKNHKTQEEEIKKKNLSSCISEYLDSPKIRLVATRAVWLGNDETHYVRTWEDNDLADLKTLIQLTAHWIESEELTNQLLEKMPPPNKQ